MILNAIMDDCLFTCGQFLSVKGKANRQGKPIKSEHIYYIVISTF